MTKESTKSFEAFKATLSSALLLIVPDPKLDYEMSTDASRSLCHRRRNIPGPRR